jgi:hypothetical protein
MQLHWCFGFSELDVDALLDWILGCQVYSIGFWPRVAQKAAHFLGLPFSLLLMH